MSGVEGVGGGGEGSWVQSRCQEPAHTRPRISRSGGVAEEVPTSVEAETAALPEQLTAILSEALARSNAERLLAHYERIADTLRSHPPPASFRVGPRRARKLVAHEPDDETGSELLQQIAAAKARLVQAGTIRKPRDLGGDEDLLTPFEIPACWRWVRLDRVGAIIGGGTPSASDSDNFAEPGTGVPWLTPADLGNFSELLISHGARDLSETGFKTSSATLMPAGTVLVTSRAPIGYVAISAKPISTNQGFKSLVPYIPDCSRFIALAMKAFAPEIDANAPGTTFKEVSGKIVAGIPFPLPPLAEQHRIVTKVDELMALCDQLEAARTERESTRNRLAAASLARLKRARPGPGHIPRPRGLRPRKSHPPHDPP